MSNRSPHTHWSAILGDEDLRKQQEFFDVRVKHPKLDQVVKQMLPILTPYSDSNIIFVVGATGAGKSTVSRIALKNMYERAFERLRNDRSVIPFIAVEAYANGDSRHTFRELYEDMLTELQEPSGGTNTLLDEKDGIIKASHVRRNTIKALRRTVQGALKRRQTEVCVIDEAYHLLRLGKDTAVMDTLKSLANKTDMKIVLVGSYELFDLLATHAQIARRASIIHFERYNLKDANDRRAFKSIVISLVAKWPCKEKPNFPAISDDLLEVTLGLVGLLKSLLLDVSAMQLQNDGKWDPHFLPRAAKSNKLREIIRREIEAGEDKVRDALLGESLWDEKSLAALVERMGG
jgi:predicted kinase